MAKLLYFDCFSGVSGDMMLGALIDAGLPILELRRALGSLAVDGCDISAERVLRAGISASRFRLHEADHHNHDDHHTPRTDAVPASSGAHQHPADHAHHRTLAEIEALIARSALSDPGKKRARELFRRLGEAEAAIHQMPIEQVHLHEVGALDSIIDIVGAVFGLEWFGADSIISSPLNVGGGTVHSAHGLLPVPAPATVRLLGDAPIYSSGVQAELVTPTGALLVTAYATAYGPIPPMRVAAVGYGAGSRELAGTPNVFRLLVGDNAAGPTTERIVVLECEIDDMNPQIFGALMERLHHAGALDVFYAPIQMKKNRPGTLVTVLAPLDRRERLSAVMFSETTTIGLRCQEVDRERLDRETLTVPTSVGAIRFKIARRHGRIVNASPEFDDCARVATERSLALKDVQAIATKAYLELNSR